MRSYCDIQYGKLGDPAQKLDIHLPDEGDSFPVFLYFHGGGIVKGDKGGYHVAQTLTKHGVALVSANYRMFPTAKYPEFIEDCAEAVAWTFENIGKYCKMEGIFVGGSSAGGYLSMMLCFDKRWLGAHGISPLQITGYIHNAGQPTTHFNVLKFSGVDARRVIVDERSPLYYIGADEEYSPMLIIVSDNDMENRYEQTMLTVATLKHFGHGDDKVKLIVMNGKHCQHVRKESVDENGDNIFGVTAANYIKSVMNKA